MNPARTRLGIDFGTTHTVGAVENADGVVTPLLFDASPLLVSAVYAEPAGGLSTGRDAERGALHDPSRFEPNPKLRVDDGRILLGDAEFEVEELIAAPLRRVAVEAGRQLAVPPAETVLTYPAAWAARRREVLTRAAERAGLGPVTLVPEPVAAATFHAHGLGRPLSAGAALAVYDLGGGTFDVTIVRRTASGWQIVAAAGLDDFGGIDLDESIVDHLGTTVGARAPRRWRSLLSPTDHAGRRALRAFRDDVRGAKEQLSRTASAVVRVPGLEVEAYLSREEFEAVALPQLNRTVDLLARVLDQARLPADDLSGLFLVGGSSRIPLVATLLHRRFGIAPMLVDQPELVVALGSLRAPQAARAGEPDSSPEPAAAPAPPTPTSPSMPPPPTPNPSARPAPPAAGEPPAAPAEPLQPRRRRRRTAAAVLPVVLVVLLLGAWQVAGLLLRHTGGSGSGPDGEASRAPRGSQRVAVDKTAWYGGFRATFGTATYAPAADPPLTISMKVQNLGRKDQGLFQLSLPISATFDGRTTPGTFPGPTVTVGSGSTVDVTVAFALKDRVANLSAGILTVGDNDALVATVPIGASGTLVTLEPVQVLADTTVVVGDLRFNHLRCELRGDELFEYAQVRQGTRAIGCTFDVAYTGTDYDAGVYGENLRLVMPSGDLRAPTRAPIGNVGRDQQVQGFRAVFVVPWPAPGRYTLRLRYLDRYKSSEVHNSADVALTVPTP